MKATEVILILAVVVLCFVSYSFFAEAQRLERELQECTEQANQSLLDRLIQ